MIAHDGAEATEKWLRGVKANLARRPPAATRRSPRHPGWHLRHRPGQRLLRGSHEERRSRHRRPQVGRRHHMVIRPTFANAKSGGTHVNVSGAAVARMRPTRPTPLNCWITWCPSPPRRCMPRPTMNTRCAGREARPRDRQLRRAQDRPAAPDRNRQASQAGQRTGRQGRLRQLMHGGRALGRGSARSRRSPGLPSPAPAPCPADDGRPCAQEAGRAGRQNLKLSTYKHAH